MTRPGIEPRSLGPLANTLTIMPKFVLCFVLQLEEIYFLSQGFSFIAMFRSSRVRFHQFVAL